MAKCLVFVTEGIVVWPNYYPTATTVFPHSWQSSIFIRFPRIERIPLVLASADFAQVLYSVVALVAVDVVYLLRRPSPLADRPDGMVQTNINLSLAQMA